MKRTRKRYPAFLRAIPELLRRYYAHDVARDSAALTYYLLFAIFPLLIFLSSLLGLLHLDIEALIGTVSQVVPDEVAQIVRGYLVYVTENSSRELMWFSLVFSVWFPMRAASCLMHSVRKAFCVGTPQRWLRQTVLTLLFTVGMIVALAAALALITLGRGAMRFFANFFVLTDAFIHAWGYLRFVLLFVLMAAVIAALYLLSQSVCRSLRDIAPGVLTSVGVWMALSLGFSYYVEARGRYTVLYGSIAAVIVALLWLYMSATVLIMGAELTGILNGRHETQEEHI